MIKKAGLCLALLSSVSTTYAADFIQWTDTSLTALYGHNYKMSSADEQTTITFESAGAWKYGDWFWFEDFIHNDGAQQDSKTNYGEFSPRLSFGKIFNTDLSVGPMTDVLATFTYEHGEGNVETWLYGLAADFKIPYFTYFQLNAYRRDAQNNNSSGWQLTPSYRIDIPVGSSNVVIDGYIDWVFESDDDQGYKRNLHINPQIKYDLGQIVVSPEFKNRLMVGIEYDYWHHKYGVGGNIAAQNTYSVIVKYHF